MRRDSCRLLVLVVVAPDSFAEHVCLSLLARLRDDDGELQTSCWSPSPSILAANRVFERVHELREGNTDDDPELRLLLVDQHSRAVSVERNDDDDFVPFEVEHVVLVEAGESRFRRASQKSRR